MMGSSGVQGSVPRSNERTDRVSNAARRREERRGRHPRQAAWPTERRKGAAGSTSATHQRAHPAERSHDRTAAVQERSSREREEGKEWGAWTRFLGEIVARKGGDWPEAMDGSALHKDGDGVAAAATTSPKQVCGVWLA